ncbi:signal recognition particle-docking protein FtsY, partial [Pasteurella multocida]|nr:signal recognition particle-docking protein FtsY [Pasteurella multocida]NMR63206.1 signal recognition particle-docking protein FtsY [Pasteurella multocida]
TENKKGGFWSWLGLGKKNETPERNQTSPGTESSDKIEQVKETNPEVEPQIDKTEGGVFSNEISSSTTSNTPRTFSPTLDKTDSQPVNSFEGVSLQSSFQQAFFETISLDCLF